MEIKKLRAVLVGAGNRSCVYADYSLQAPDELQIVGVVEPSELRRQEAAARYCVDKKNCFSDLDGFLQANIACDFVINATMDEMHYETAKKLITAGYDMLLEKPVVPNREQLLDLQALAKEKGVKVNICHVLRYTPFYKRIKELINGGAIGKIMTMELNEHVWIAHFLDSFVRGKWNSEKRCGSGFLLQKSCHDMDLICWLNNATQPKKVVSVGTRAQFIKENVPDGATEFCYNCPHNGTCLYSAQKVHLELDSMPFQTWMDMNKPLDEITKEEKAEFLKTSVYGRCAYNSGGDINDRQTVNVLFENGSIASFTMVGATNKPGRYIHICGTKGEIEGRLEDGKFVLRIFDRSGDKFWYDEELVDVNKDVVVSVEYGGHGGGDYAIMYELVRYFSGDTSSVSITSLDDSVNGHLVVYAAEESVKKDTAIFL
ncbi:MAG: Gfo/Idh/MocA family oxidoreductase [Clostridia bacterium]|nr:Gfo/Idh/MocA family oxidoreductase [Clostridia bacterium]